MFWRGRTRRSGRTARAGGLGLLAAILALGGASGCGTGTGGASSSGGAGWEPTQDVTMVVPFSPGGGSDIFGRAMAKGIEEVRPGVNVTVENRPSGNGAVGYSYVFAREGDGHYLVPSETSGVALPMTTETPWEWRDFTPVTQVAEDATLMVVPADSRYQNLQDVIEAGKQGTQPRMGVAGATGLDSIVTGLMERDQGIEFRRVTFDSGGEIVAALLGGDIDTAMLNPSEVIGQLEAGKMRAVAAFAEDRYDRPPLDDIPTAKEQGVDVSFTQYRGAFAPGGLPDDQLAYWEETIGKWMKTASYQEFIESNFLRPVRRPHDEFVSYLQDYEKQLETVLERQ